MCVGAASRWTLAAPSPVRTTAAFGLLLSEQALQPQPQQQGVAGARRRPVIPGIQRSFMVRPVAVRSVPLPGLPAQCIPYETARSPHCETLQAHADRPSRTVCCRRAGRIGAADAYRERRGAVVLRQLQGCLRSVLQEKPGSIQVPDPAAALPGKLHQEQALKTPSARGAISCRSFSGKRSSLCGPARL
jgi:hypothetical protein